MVRLALKPSLRLASCCRVDVLKGGEGLRLTGLASTLPTENFCALMAATARSASPWLPRVSFSIF
jgi:hypothetical protein